MGRSRYKQPEERKKIDARSPEAKRAGVTGGRFDAFGNLVGGRQREQSVVGGSVDEAGNYAGGGRLVKAGDEVSFQGTSTLAKHKAGQSTPRLNAFQSAKPVTPSQAPVRGASHFDPRLGGDITAPATGKEISASVRAPITAKPRENWKQLTLAEKKAAHAADPSLPVPGKTAAMDNKLEVARAKVQMESRGETARQRKTAFDARGTSADPAVRADDKKTLAERGTIAVDPRYAGNGQLTNQKVMGEYVTKGGGSTSPTSAPKWPPTKTAGVTIPTAADMTPKTAFAGAPATPAIAYRPQAPGMPAVTAPDTRMPAVAAAPMQPVAAPERPGMVKGFNPNRPANDWDNQVALKRESTRQAQNTPAALAARQSSEAGARKAVDDLSYFPRKALEASGNVAQAVGNAASAVGGAAADVVQTVTDPAKQRSFAEGMGVKTQDAPRATAFSGAPAPSTAMNEKKRKPLS